MVPRAFLREEERLSDEPKARPQLFKERPGVNSNANPIHFTMKVKLHNSASKYKVPSLAFSSQAFSNLLPFSLSYPQRLMINSPKRAAQNASGIRK